MNPPVNVYVVDDQKAVRDSVAALLRSAGFETRSFASAIEFLHLATALEPGYLLSDVRMPEMDGIALLKRLKALKLDFPVILMTGHGDVRMVVEAIKTGAADFIEKPFTRETLLEAIQKLETYLPAVGRGYASERLSHFTVRERQVFDRLVAGMPNKVIAHELDLSVRTVEFYRTRVMMKAGVESLSELVQVAWSAGLRDQRTP
jgi:two-component system response regulator FixJ